MAETASPAVLAVEHSYARFRDTIQILMHDGTTFIIDRTAVSFMSPELDDLVDAMDPDSVQIRPMPEDDSTSWRIALDVFYSHKQGYEAATQAQLEQAMLLCGKYKMVTVRDQLACILLQQFEDCDAAQLADTLRDGHSPARRAFDRLLEWEVKSNVPSAQLFKLPVSQNLARHTAEQETRKRQDAKDELGRLIDIMLEQDIASCKNGNHGPNYPGNPMAHTMWRRAISDVRSAQIDHNPPYWSAIVNDSRSKYMSEQECSKCKGKLNDAFNRVTGRARREIQIRLSQQYSY